jgi:hypothetical protein
MGRRSFLDGFARLTAIAVPDRLLLPLDKSFPLL